MKIDRILHLGWFCPLIFEALNPTDGFTRVSTDSAKQKLHFRNFFLELENLFWFRRYFVLDNLKMLETPCMFFAYEKKNNKVITSRPKARDGHRYPCPALVFCSGSSYVSRAAAPEETGGDKVL